MPLAWGTAVDGVCTFAVIDESGETWLTRTMSDFQFAGVCEIRRLDGRLFRLESDGRSKTLVSMAEVGVVGGVEKVSGSCAENMMVEILKAETKRDSE